MSLNLIFVHAVLIMLFGAASLIMVYDLYLEQKEAEFFYVVTMGILLIRLGGVNILTRIIHFLTNVFLIGILIYIPAVYSNDTELSCLYWLLIAIIITFLISLHLMVFRPGRNYNERGNQASLHAVMGILCAILFFWICCFFFVRDKRYPIFESFFFLFFLFILLTPHFQSVTHAANIAQYGPPPENEFTCPSNEHLSNLEYSID